MKICRVFDHQNKSAAYKQALFEAGYVFTERSNINGVRFFLSDADWRESMMAEARSRNIPVFLYPHAARPMVIYDGCVEPKPVCCMFTQAPGGKAIMEKIGYPYPVEVSGWAYSEVRPFRPVEKVNRVLFAPIHPNGNGWLSDIDKQINVRTFSALQIWCYEHQAQLSIRYIGTPEQCGLGEAAAFEAPYIEWHQGRKNNSTADMESADLVVAHQTFAWIAVALGIPTGAAIGTVNGFFHVKFKLPSFIVTICTMYLFRGVCAYLTTETAVPASSAIKALDLNWLKITITIAVLLIAFFLFQFTRIGSDVKAIGSGETAARFSGVRTDLVKFLVFVAAGALTGLAAFVNVIKVGSITSTAGNQLETQILISLVLGGLPITGGAKVHFSNIVVGTLMYTVLNNGLVMLGYDLATQQLIKGVIFLIFVALTIDRKALKVIK